MHASRLVSRFRGSSGNFGIKATPANQGVGGPLIPEVRLASFRGGTLARRPLLAALPLALAALLVRRAQAADGQVTIDNFTFNPARLTVRVGTKVVWTNRDDIPHTVTSAANPRLLKSQPLDTGDQFDFTFAKPGTYRYFCSLHPHMQGMVVVQ